MTSDEKLNSSEKFHQYFSSEVLLQQALAGLLVKMPDTWGVQILQGSQELGKDLVFYTRGGFGEPLLCACVVKNKRVTGEVAKSEGARTVFFQAQQAFDSPHIDANGRDVPVERVYVVTPFPLAPPTISSIRGSLKERSGQVVFVGGTELFDLFKQYWPDFLADEADAIESHLTKTSRTYEEDNPISRVAAQYHLGEVESAARKIYVPQQLHRQVYSYTLGSVFDDTVPSGSFLFAEWNKEIVEARIRRLEDLGRALKFFYEWQYFSPSVSIDNVLKTVEWFGYRLRDSWMSGLRSKYKFKLTDIRLVDRDATAKPDEPIEIESRAAELRATVDRSLEPLFEALTAAAKTISDASSSPETTVFSHESFQLICRLDDCAHSAPSGVFRRKQKVDIRLPADVLERWEESLMIVGSPGFGKTSFCRWHALQDVERFSALSSDILPIYHPLHRFANHDLEDFQDAFLSDLGKSGLVVRDEGGQEASRVRLYLDGLDEIPSEVKRKQLVQLVHDNVMNDKKVQIVLTARDFVRGPWLHWLPRVNLSGFNEIEVTNLITQWFAKSEHDAQAFAEQLQGVPTLSGLMHTPLLATLIILVFKQTGRLPDNRTRLYGIFVDLMSGGWDLTKGILRDTKFPQAVKEMVLMTLARNQHNSWSREFNDAEIVSAMEENLSSAFLDQWEAFRDELVVDGLITRSADIYQFAHLSFQEFLAAKSFLGDTQPRAVHEAVEAFLDGEDWWREVIHFYIGLKGNPKGTCNWLLSEIDTFDRRNLPLREHANYLFRCIKESFPGFPLEDALVGTPFRAN